MGKNKICPGLSLVLFDNYVKQITFMSICHQWCKSITDMTVFIFCTSVNRLNLMNHVYSS